MTLLLMKDSRRTTSSKMSIRTPGGKKNLWLLGKFEGRRSIHHQVGEWGSDVWDGVRTWFRERLPSVNPATTSEQCVWTQVHAGVVTITSDQPVCDRCVVFGFVARWKVGFMI
jgi:hypothetical protein